MDEFFGPRKGKPRRRGGDSLVLERVWARRKLDPALWLFLYGREPA